MNLIYERDTAHNYMIPQREQYVAEDDYRVHMLMENQIRGLLPCGIRKRDGIEDFRYDITSRQSLEYLYSGRCMGEEEIEKVSVGCIYAGVGSADDLSGCGNQRTGFLLFAGL